MSAEVVVLEYADLLQGKDLGAEIEAAFGFHGIGLLVGLSDSHQ